MTKVYFASKIQHATLWATVGSTTVGIEMCCRWANHILSGASDDDPADLEAGWKMNLEDIEACDMLIVYATTKAEARTLRGALVEVGMALAFKKPVLAVAGAAFEGSWQYHFLVQQVPTIDEALSIARAYRQQ